MPDIKPFFSVNAWGDSLTTGATLKIVHSLNYSDYTASPHMAPLVELPAAELQEKLEAREPLKNNSFFDSTRDRLEKKHAEFEHFM